MKMTKKRVAELEGERLDWAVAKALGLCPIPHQPIQYFYWNLRGYEESGAFAPSSEWEHGGPIIDKLVSSGEFQITPWYCKGDYPVLVSNTDCESKPVKPGDWSAASIDALGKDVLTAACRAFVMWKLGDEVEVPE